MQEALLGHIAEIKHENQRINVAVSSLAKMIIERKVLPPKCINDSLHIAAAIIGGCDYVVSWNMRHIANVRTNKGIRLITIGEGFKEIMLIPPPMLLMGSDGHD